MRSLHIDTERTWRGGEQQALYLGRGLRDRGHEVLVVGQPRSPFVERMRAVGLETVAIPMRSEADATAVGRLMMLLRRFRPDVVHMHTSHAHSLGVLACRASGIGHTIVSRRVDFSIHRTRLRLNILKYRFGVDRYIAISRGVKDVLVADGVPAGRIDIVPSGVDLDELARVPRVDYRREFGLPKDSIVVGDVAHFGWHKAQEVLVEACPRIFAEEPRVHVFLVGDGECRPKVEQLATELGVLHRLHFTGHRRDARALIRWFDVFVMCSVKEGLCTSILDAHVLATPVVASDVGGIPEIVQNGETGLAVPPRDPVRLANAVVRLVRQRGLAELLALQGQRLVREQYSVDAMVEGTLRVYRDVVGGFR